MHTGTAVRRGDDWFGSAVNIAARVADLASPGEVLCTAATRDALGRAVPVRSRGPQRLKNVAEPITVYELVVQGPLGDLPVDPVCRMAVDPARAVARREVERKTYYFCSEGCADAFDADPGAYLEGAERGTH
jgi:YHS domain-containing protein